MTSYNDNLVDRAVIRHIEDEIDIYDSEPDGIVEKLKYRTDILLCNMCTMYNTFTDHMGKQFQTISEQKILIENLRRELDECKNKNIILENKLLELKLNK